MIVYKKYIRLTGRLNLAVASHTAAERMLRRWLEYKYKRRTIALTSQQSCCRQGSLPRRKVWENDASSHSFALLPRKKTVCWQGAGINCSHPVRTQLEFVVVVVVRVAYGLPAIFKIRHVSSSLHFAKRSSWLLPERRSRRIVASFAV